MVVPEIVWLPLQKDLSLTPPPWTIATSCCHIDFVQLQSKRVDRVHFQEKKLTNETTEIMIILLHLKVIKYFAEMILIDIVI